MSPRIIHAHLHEEYWFEEGCYILEIGNTDNDPDISIARARVEPGQRTCWHHLDGIFERYLVTEGHGTVEIGDLEPAGVSTGDLVLIPPGVRQRITNSGNTDLVFYAICSPRFMPGHYRGLETPASG